MLVKSNNISALVSVKLIKPIKLDTYVSNKPNNNIIIEQNYLCLFFKSL